MHRFRASTEAALACACFLLAVVSTPARAGEVTVYSSREPVFIEPLLRVFEGLTGHRVTFVYAGPDIVARLKEEGRSTKADLLIASDFSQLVAAKRLAFTRPIRSVALTDRIADVYRDTDGHWYALTRRARIIAVSKRLPTEADPRTYEDLAAERFRGRVCVRSGQHPYNVALLASMLAQRGGEAAEGWLRGIKRNMARKPTGGDRDQLTAVSSGACDVALINSYYVAGMLKSDDAKQKAAAQSVRIIMPNVGDRGTHFTISGMAIASSAKHVAEAELLMDFLTSRPAQKIFAQDNEEWPVREDERASAIVESLGPVEAENVSLADLATLFPSASSMVAKVAFDEGPPD